MSGNEARVVGWGGQPARWSASFGNNRSVVSRHAPVQLADNGACCLAGAVPGMRLIVEPRLLLWMGSCGFSRANIDRLSALVGWHGGAATQRAGVDRRAMSVHRATATPASECTFHRNYVCPSVPTQNGTDGLAE